MKETCRACKALKKEWYGYLKKTGFEDIEQGLLLVKNDDQRKKDWQTHYQMDAKYTYYQWAQQKRDDGNFKASFSTREQMIWDYHSEGMSRREIAPRVGFEQSYVTRKLKIIEEFLKEHSVSSGSAQLDLMFWAKADSPFR